MKFSFLSVLAVLFVGVTLLSFLLQPPAKPEQKKTPYLMVLDGDPNTHDGQLKTLSFLLNSLSLKKKIVQPKRDVINSTPRKQVAVFVPEDYGLFWGHIHDRFHESDEHTVATFIKRTMNPLVFYNVMWSIYDLKTFRKVLKVPDTSLREANALAALTSDSQIVDDVSLVLRYPTVYGYYYERRALTVSKREAIFSPTTATWDHLEAFGTLPNGLLLHGSFDKEGKLLHVSPVEITMDTSGIKEDQRTIPPLSCYGCHLKGPLPFEDYVRDILPKKNLVLLTTEKDKIKEFKNLYFPPIPWSRDQKTQEDTFKSLHTTPQDIFRLFKQQLYKASY